jgi:hypothetical protein
MKSTPSLEIFIHSACPGMQESVFLANRVRKTFPGLSIRVIDVHSTNEEIPPDVFAVPTYLLDGVTIFLGNPTEHDLRNRIEALTHYSGG